MALSLKKTEEAYNLLKEYKGDNTYIINLKNNVFAYQIKTLNDFEAEYILSNHNKEPRQINKIVVLANWWGEKMKEEWNTEFIPQKIKITWLMGETQNHYHFYCIYRRSQEKAVSVFAPKNAILTDFTSEDWTTKEIDFTPYNKRSGRPLYPHQEDAVKFLTTRKKAILADSMGFGKTTSAIVSALEDKYKHVLIISPASVKTTWKSELMRYVDEDEITIVEGSKWKDNKFTIINYDILKNFYEIPTEVVKKTTLEMDDDGIITKVTKEKERVSRKNKVISKAMENSQLYQSNFDLIIIDEAHRLSNTSSGIYKIVSDLISRAKPFGIYAITGTPITNRPINFFNILKIIGAPLANDWKNYVERYCDGKSFYNKKERNAHTAIFCNMKGKPDWYSLSSEEKSELDKYLERKCKKIWVTDGASNLEELNEIIKTYYIRRDKSDLELPNKRVKILNYELTDIERYEYNNVWEEYKNAQNNKDINNLEKYKKITEGIMMRQWLAMAMIPKTVDLVKKCVELGHKVVIFCAFDEELKALKEEFDGISVFHNGKINIKKKDKAVSEFQNNPNIKVFIGNIQSASVGLTLIAADVMVFNSFSWVSGEDYQAEDRIHRIGQKKNVTIYYQVFKDTFYEEMLDKVRGKQDIIDKIIISEKEK